MNRRLIVSAMTAMSAFALLSIAYAFISSLNPSEASLARLPRIPIPELKPGQFVFVKNPVALDNWPADMLFVRKLNRELDVWEVPVKDGKHILPDLQWWRQGPLCSRFVPDFDTQKISCVDSNLSDWAKQNYQWDINGKNLGKSGVKDMMRMHGIEENDEYVLYKEK